MKDLFFKKNLTKLLVGLISAALFAGAVAWANSGRPQNVITDSTGGSGAPS